MDEGGRDFFWLNCCFSGATWLCLAPAALGSCGTWLHTAILQARVDSYLWGFFLSQIFLKLVKFGPRERHVLIPVWHSSKSFLPVLCRQPGTVWGRSLGPQHRSDHHTGNCTTAPLAAGNRPWGWAWGQKCSPCLSCCVCGFLSDTEWEKKQEWHISSYLGKFM